MNDAEKQSAVNINKNAQPMMKKKALKRAKMYLKNIQSMGSNQNHLTNN